ARRHWPISGMTLFPIVGRELRVAARQRGTYWMRLAIASMAILIGTGIFVVTLGLSAAQTGRHIFEWLAGLQFIYCLAYGRRSTADCLSQEKRDGTLGLLFLTDLKGHDVVLRQTGRNVAERLLWIARHFSGTRRSFAPGRNH